MKGQSTTLNRGVTKSHYTCELGREYFRIVICDGNPIEVFMQFELEGMNQITLTNSDSKFDDEVKKCMSKLLKSDFKKFKAMCEEISINPESKYFTYVQDIINDELKEVRHYENDLEQLLLFNE